MMNGTRLDPSIGVNMVPAQVPDRSALVQRGSVRAVVTGEDDDGVVTQAESLNGVEQPSHVVIHLGKASAQSPCPVLPLNSAEGSVG